MKIENASAASKDDFTRQGKNRKQIKTYQLAALKRYYDRKEMNLQFWKNSQGILISVRLVVNAE